MNRREFLKISSIAMLLSLTQLSGIERGLFSPSEVEFQGKRYRGTRDGKIYVSATGGETWSLHTNLGNLCAVTGLQAGRDGNFYSLVNVQGHPFTLALTRDGKSWRSVA